MITKLSVGAENLLKEIIDHRGENNVPDSDYWKVKYQDMTFDNKVVIGSQFKELEDSQMIRVTWADGYPFFMQILNNGWAYEADRKRDVKATNQERRKEFWRTMIVGVVSAIIGVLVGKIL